MKKFSGTFSGCSEFLRVFRVFNCFEILVKKFSARFQGVQNFREFCFEILMKKSVVFMVFRISARFQSVYLSKTHTEFQLSRNLSEKNFGAFSECPGYQNLRRISIVSKFWWKKFRCVFGVFQNFGAFLRFPGYQNLNKISMVLKFSWKKNSARFQDFQSYSKIWGLFENSSAILKFQCGLRVFSYLAIFQGGHTMDFFLVCFFSWFQKLLVCFSP